MEIYNKMQIKYLQKLKDSNNNIKNFKDINYDNYLLLIWILYKQGCYKEYSSILYLNNIFYRSFMLENKYVVCG